MQTDWLTDLMTLAQTRSFSRAAQLREITQSAFSRRIRSLEAWAGVDLVDRGRHPPALTPAGKHLLAQAPGLVGAVQRMHARMHACGRSGQDVLEVAAPHALALHFFPAWLGQLDDGLGHARARVTTALGTQDGLQRLSDGACDLLLTYRGAGTPLPATRQPFTPHVTPHFAVLPLERERLLPCTRPDAGGRPLHHLAAPPIHGLPYLAHSKGTDLDRWVEDALADTGQHARLRRVFESDSPETLKALALAGRGIAFLPERSIQSELHQGRLLPAGDALQTVLDICLLRAHGAGAPCDAKPTLDRFWAWLHDPHARAARPGAAPRAWPRFETLPASRSVTLHAG